MTRHFSTVLAFGAALVAAGALGHAASAKDEKVGEVMCIQANDIDQTTAIGHKAIVVKMRGPTRGYKRIDIANNCTGLNNADPWAFDTSINKLCRQDTLKILVPAGQTCLIDKIVNIDDAEAKTLLAGKH